MFFAPYASINNGSGDYPYQRELNTLWRIAKKLEAGRGKAEAGPPPFDYNFYVENDRISIVPRLRGSPLDKVVSELMITANATWGKALADANIAAIYRTQGNGRSGGWAELVLGGAIVGTRHRGILARLVGKPGVTWQKIRAVWTSAITRRLEM